ncbi:hypothetical protein JR316_0011089 [Psilocybe cubensis]|nr:hypothetical protein JR316_0011089 [Psilocybe cubensis]KAH9477171.1 hypothetical protein JR316_0011089 [Psilocybe cubensis]
MVERRAQVSRMKDGYSWHPYDPQAAKFKSNPKASMISSSVEPSHDTVTVKTEVPSFEETALACKAPRSEKFSQLISFFSPQGALKLFPVIDCQFQNCSARLTGLDAFAKHIFGPTSEGGHGLLSEISEPPFKVRKAGKMPAAL